MKYQLHDLPRLGMILYADAFLGGVTGLTGLFFSRTAALFLGFPRQLVLVIAGVTFAYALLALVLACKSVPPVQPLRVLIFANWGWSLVSIAMVFLFIPAATIFGAIFLVLQVMVVGGLAWLEGRHVFKTNQHQTFL